MFYTGLYNYFIHNIIYLTVIFFKLYSQKWEKGELKRMICDENNILAAKYLPMVVNFLEYFDF
ncbi:MAG: hypothetical protein KBC18_05455 [Candidatus Saccharicenans sp.]|jgi:hypothetical protein|nr:hypothetical protein [Candidatus Saccharicenans sp.]